MCRRCRGLKGTCWGRTPKTWAWQACWLKSRGHEWLASKQLREMQLASVSVRFGALGPPRCVRMPASSQGDSGDHLQLRQRVMEYVEEREEEYKFFM